jgi:copper homeostasis protein
VEDAVAAEHAGADRLELCAALEVGGLTPSQGLLEQVLQSVSIPVMAMVRPRVGGFVYDAAEQTTMQWEIQRLLQSGAQGVVLGVLSPDGRVNFAACQRMLRECQSVQRVFHRAIDFARAPGESLRGLVDLGFTRVLTSGGQASALVGAATIADWQQRFGDSLEILPGGGIRPENVRQLLRETGCQQLHLSSARRVASRPLSETNPALGLNDLECLTQEGHRVFCPAVFDQLRRALGKAPSKLA